MLENIYWLGHNTIKINKNNTIIYIDPYKIDKNTNDADIIFITHSHYDHYSEEDINKIRKNDTTIIVPTDLYKSVKKLGFLDSNIINVIPNHDYKCKNIKFSTIPAYNVDKKFHPKDNNWVGYLIEINNLKYYIAGDTDITCENEKVKCDVAFVPIGGTYTMDYKEAANLINQISPKVVIPIHYGLIVGNVEDAKKFKNLLKNNINCDFMTK